MEHPLQPGVRGERLPDGENVLRFIRGSKDNRASEVAFILSAKDEAAELKSLSVWAEHITTPEQALAFMEANREAYPLYAVLSVAAIRQLRPEPDSPAVPHLDVVWDPLTDEVTGLPDARPGAEGHAGITGLVRPTGLPNAKLLYRSLRYKLADLANANIETVTDLP